MITAHYYLHDTIDKLAMPECLKSVTMSVHFNQVDDFCISQGYGELTF